jgi:hypothetical protein
MINGVTIKLHGTGDATGSDLATDKKDGATWYPINLNCWLGTGSDLATDKKDGATCIKLHGTQST